MMAALLLALLHCIWTLHSIDIVYTESQSGPVTETCSTNGQCSDDYYFAGDRLTITCQLAANSCNGLRVFCGTFDPPGNIFDIEDMDGSNGQRVNCIVLCSAAGSCNNVYMYCNGGNVDSCEIQHAVGGFTGTTLECNIDPGKTCQYACSSLCSSGNYLLCHNGSPCSCITQCDNITPTPVTSTPTTSIPTTTSPTTSIPTTNAPSTISPTSSSPTTANPTTSMPSSYSPTTQSPTTVAPTTTFPSTSNPTTSIPTTLFPTTLLPTTSAPTSIPTTLLPTTLLPTTAAPTLIPTISATPTLTSHSMSMTMADMSYIFIIIGCVLIVLLTGIIIFWYKRSRSRRNDKQKMNKLKINSQLELQETNGTKSDGNIISDSEEIGGENDHEIDGSDSEKLYGNAYENNTLTVKGKREINEQSDSEKLYNTAKQDKSNATKGGENDIESQDSDDAMYMATNSTTKQ